MQPSFTKKPRLRICKIDMNTKKINGSRRETFGIVIALFQLDDKDRKSFFFKKTFLLVNISMIVAFGMPFLILSNVKINFNNQELKWKSYTTTKVLSNTR